MAYAAVPTVTTGDLWTASNHNTYIRDNFAAGVPDIFTAKGDIAVATAADVATALAVGSNNQVLMAASGEASGLKWSLVTAGVQTIWIPSEAMSPETTDGCGEFDRWELTAGNPEVTGLPFDGSSAEYAQFKLPLPKKWNRGTLTAIFFWSSTATDTDGVAWTIAGISLDDGDSIDTAFGTAVTVVDNAQSAANEMLISDESGAITIGGSPAVGDFIFMRVGRNTAHASDGHAEDARLLGVHLFYTTEADTDD